MCLSSPSAPAAAPVVVEKEAPSPAPILKTRTPDGEETLVADATDVQQDTGAVSEGGIDGTDALSIPGTKKKTNITTSV